MAGVGVAQVDLHIAQLLLRRPREAERTRAAVLVARVDRTEEHPLGRDDVSGFSEEQHGGAQLEVEARFDDAQIVVKRQNLDEKKQHVKAEIKKMTQNAAS